VLGREVIVVILRGRSPHQPSSSSFPTAATAAAHHLHHTTEAAFTEAAQ
jgi:hypothetical protein